MVPNKTIYIREADADVWQRAEKLAGDSVSALITEALRRYVEQEDQKERTDMERIEIELWGPEERPCRAASLVSGCCGPTRTRRGPASLVTTWAHTYGVALTQRGNIAVYIRHVNDGFAPRLRTYRTFEEAEKGFGMPGDILAMAASEISDGYVQKLEI